ncbi:MAG TPA: hypothetical protein H9727_05680 [Candidatus Borkfalkia avistercoris]|uniref:Uncharacterized protein n=1 Tax=Candidatus Borkfalkia avistercoris TaxID=2838504 RepID=A0A9D2CZM1_9FIRM|nr:hypothetical protein [Candidatus Borkfalkia avistercoris]
MKKKFAVLAALLACLFAFAACSSRVTVSLNRNWNINTTAAYDSAFYERLTYNVRYEEPESSTLSGLKYADMSGTYTITTRAATRMEANQAYQLTSELEISGRIVNENGETVYAFGGDSGNPADSVVTTVYFRDTSDGLAPIESTASYYSHTPAQNGSVFIYKYETKITYNDDASSATVTITDKSSEVTELDESEAENTTVRIGVADTGESSLSSLTKNYSVFDNAQLIFAGRGLTFAADSSNTVTVVSAEGGSSNVTLSCTEVVDRTYSFNFDGSAVENATITTCVVNFTRSGAGSNTGPTHTVDYANRNATVTSNTYRNMPLRIETNLSYAMGAFIYSLADATHTAPAE